MFRSKKASSSASTVSPLQPPPASTAPYHQQQQQQQQQPQQQHYGSPHPQQRQQQQQQYPQQRQFSPPPQQRSFNSSSSSGSIPPPPAAGQPYPSNYPDAQRRQDQQYFTTQDKRERRQSLLLSGIPQHMYNDSNGFGAPSPSGYSADQSDPSARPGQGQGQGQGSVRARPKSIGPGMGLPSPTDSGGSLNAPSLQRISTAGTTGTTASDTGTAKEKKRRSGFFGFGKKDKDKDKDKDKGKDKEREKEVSAHHLCVVVRCIIESYFPHLPHLTLQLCQISLLSPRWALLTRSSARAVIHSPSADAQTKISPRCRTLGKVPLNSPDTPCLPSHLNYPNHRRLSVEEEEVKMAVSRPVQMGTLAQTDGHGPTLSQAKVDLDLLAPQRTLGLLIQVDIPNRKVWPLAHSIEAIP